MITALNGTSDVFLVKPAILNFFFTHIDIPLRFSFEQLKKHDYFKTIKWDSILTTLPPFVPDLASIDDTSHFDYEDLGPT